MLSAAAMLATVSLWHGQLPPDLANAYTDWGLCRGEYVAAHFADESTPETIADAALAACAGHEARAASITGRMGPGWRGTVQGHRAVYREEAIQTVSELRSGRSPSNPATAWGVCIGQRIDQVPEAAPVATAVDGLFDACRRLEAAVLRDLARRLGEERAPAMLELLRRELRTQLVQRIEAGTLPAGN